MNTRLMFSSKTDLWSTPQEVFDLLDIEFNFTLDVCASKENTKCDRYFDIKDNGLEQDWSKDICWMNPPYGREINKWIEKASRHKVVALLPARTDTKWFHDHVYNKAEIRFIKGRLKFGNQKNNAPFPSMIVIFN